MTTTAGHDLKPRKPVGGQKRTATPRKSVAGSVCAWIAARADWEPLAWQEEVLTAWLDGSHRTAAISTARGNGKTELCAAVAAAVIDPTGPLYQGSRSQVIVATPTQALGAETVLPSVCRIVGAPMPGSRAKHDDWKVSSLTARPSLMHSSGSGLSVIGAKSVGAAHGIAPQFLIVDEPAQYRGKQGAELWATAFTSLGKVPDSRALVIGTRSSNPEHWFSKLLEDPTALVFVYSADPNDPYNTWQDANPSFPTVPDEAIIDGELARAANDVHARHSFLALRCNMGTPEYMLLADRLCSDEDWRNVPVCGVKHSGSPSVVGIDLGAAISLTSVVGVWPDNTIRCHTFVGDRPNIVDREIRDGAHGLYQHAVAQGDLTLMQGVTVPPAEEVLSWILANWGVPEVILADSFKQAAMTDAAAAAGVGVEFRKRVGEAIDDDIDRLTSGIALQSFARAPSVMLDRAMQRAAIKIMASGAKKTERQPGDDPAQALLLAWPEHQRRSGVVAVEPEVWLGGVRYDI